MKELQISIHTTATGECQVTSMVKFDNQDDAVRYHEGLSALGRKFSAMQPNVQGQWPLLAWSRK